MIPYRKRKKCPKRASSLADELRKRPRKTEGTPFVLVLLSVRISVLAGPREPEAEPTLFQRHHCGTEEIVEAKFDCVYRQVVIKDSKVVDTVVAAAIIDVSEVKV